jgi:hypothetical protein
MQSPKIDTRTVDGLLKVLEEKAAEAKNKGDKNKGDRLENARAKKPLCTKLECPSWLKNNGENHECTNSAGR